MDEYSDMNLQYTLLETVYNVYSVEFEIDIECLIMNY